jgi:hypothetical protein
MSKEGCIALKKPDSKLTGKDCKSLTCPDPIRATIPPEDLAQQFGVIEPDEICNNPGLEDIIPPLKPQKRAIEANSEDIAQQFGVIEPDEICNNSQLSQVVPPLKPQKPEKTGLSIQEQQEMASYVVFQLPAIIEEQIEAYQSDTPADQLDIAGEISARVLAEISTVYAGQFTDPSILWGRLAVRADQLTDQLTKTSATLKEYQVATGLFFQFIMADLSCKPETQGSPEQFMQTAAKNFNNFPDKLIDKQGNFNWRGELFYTAILTNLDLHFQNHDVNELFKNASALLDSKNPHPLLERLNEDLTMTMTFDIAENVIENAKLFQQKEQAVFANMSLSEKAAYLWHQYEQSVREKGLWQASLPAAKWALYRAAVFAYIVLNAGLPAAALAGNLASASSGPDEASCQTVEIDGAGFKSPVYARVEPDNPDGWSRVIDCNNPANYQIVQTKYVRFSDPGIAPDPQNQPNTCQWIKAPHPDWPIWAKVWSSDRTDQSWVDNCADGAGPVEYTTDEIKFIQEDCEAQDGYKLSAEYSKGPIPKLVCKEHNLATPVPQPGIEDRMKPVPLPTPMDNETIPEMEDGFLGEKPLEVKYEYNWYQIQQATQPCRLGSHNKELCSIPANVTLSVPVAFYDKNDHLIIKFAGGSGIVVEAKNKGKVGPGEHDILSPKYLSDKSISIPEEWFNWPQDKEGNELIMSPYDGIWVLPYQNEEDKNSNSGIGDLALVAGGIVGALTLVGGAAAASGSFGITRGNTEQYLSRSGFNSRRMRKVEKWEKSGGKNKETLTENPRGLRERAIAAFKGYERIIEIHENTNGPRKVRYRGVHGRGKQTIDYGEGPMVEKRSIPFWVPGSGLFLKWFLPQTRIDK